MSLNNSLINFLMSYQSYEPGGGANAFGSAVGWLAAFLWNGICSGIYGIVKWFMAFVDFMQYFIQKLIGLDYWLNRTHYTMEGIIDSDIIFGFLYHDTVQKVFRALMGVFFVLLIIFTIYAIIRQEWRYITGKEFGNGSGNSKSQIFRESIKAIALVIVFPLMLMIGIVSANAILASLIKALNIDTGSTLGAQLFQVGSQNANRYEKYANHENGRAAVSDQITFYIYNEKYLTMSSERTDDTLTEKADDYAEYLQLAAQSRKYTVRTMFDDINPNTPFWNKDQAFNGYCAKFKKDDEAHFIMARCETSGDVNTRDGMGYYLKNVLQVPVVTQEDDVGFDQAADFGSNIDSDGYISDFDIADIKKGAIAQACYNTQHYPTIYDTRVAFEDAIEYSIIRGDALINTNGSVLGAGNGSANFLGENGLKLGVTNAKVMINSSKYSTYFDGGEKGVVALQSEYLVMSEVIKFINQNNFRLHMLDITSDLIDWSGHDAYSVDSRWINPNGVTIKDSLSDNTGIRHIPFVINYSDLCNDTEVGNVLYMGADRGENGDELFGSKYIMCIKVDGLKDASGQPINSKYIPLVNNKTYYDPVTGKSYHFKSSYYASNYSGVVLAKGVLDYNSYDGQVGGPTYLVSNQTTKKDKYAGSGDRYYYQMVTNGDFNQFVVNNENTGYAGDISVSGLTYSVETQHTVNLPEYSTAVPDSNNAIFQFVNKNNEWVEPTEELIRNLSIKLTATDSAGTSSIVSAQYANIKNNGFYLFAVTEGANAYYFPVHSDSVSMHVYSYDGTNNVWNESTDGTMKPITKLYNLKYDYVGKSNVATGDLSIYAATIEDGLAPNNFEYAKSIYDSASGSSKAIYSTIDQKFIEYNDGYGVKYKDSLYVNVTFNTTNTKLVSMTMDGDDKPKVEFVGAYAVSTDATNAGYTARSASKLMPKSKSFRFYLYDFYVGSVNGTLHKYDPKDPSNLKVEGLPTDDKWYFDITVSSDGFTFGTLEDYLHLYSGKKYVATVYKPSGIAVSSIGDLPSTTSYVLYNNKIYYNVDTQNKYASTDEMKVQYARIQENAVISCVRSNRSTVPLMVDLQMPEFLSFRFGIRFFPSVMNHEKVGDEFYIKDGIQFDYFFEGVRNDVSLFYIPSQISYWIILIACALMIKVLGSAIWGVIKRVYEITLYFLAMPAIATTIPLDDGQKFKNNFQLPLIKKVLGTYGIMLGINVFFILLYPVKTMSQIFTAEDIATSNSNFLKNLFPFLGHQLKADVLNLYVYILFVLVAFTMIDTLPTTISQIVGAEDLKSEGEKTKKAAGNTMKGAMDMLSGKTAVETGKKAIEGIKSGEFIPGGVLAKKGIEGLKSLKKKGGEPEEETEGGSTPPTTSRTGGEEGGDEDLQKVQEAINSKVGEATGGKYNTYEEAMASGDAEAMAAAQQAVTDTETEITEGGDESQIAAMQAFKTANGIGTEGNGEQVVEETTTGGENTPPVNTTEEGAKTDATQDMNKLAALLGVQSNQIVNAIGNLIKQMLGDKGKKQKVADAYMNTNKEAKKQAILAAMKQKNPNSKVTDISDEDLDKYQVHTNDTGSVSVTKTGDKGQTIDVGTTAKGYVDAANGLNINAAIDGLDASGLDALMGADADLGALKKDATSAVTGNIGTVAAQIAGIGDQLTDLVLSDPSEGNNQEIIDNAIMQMLRNDTALAKKFMKGTKLSEADFKDDEKLLAKIKDARDLGDLAKMGITEDKYKGQIAGVIEKFANEGKFSISAWDLANKTNGEGVSEFVETYRTGNGIKNDAEIALDTKLSTDIVNGVIGEDATKKGEILFNQFMEKFASQDAMIQQLIDAYAGINGQEDVNKIISGLSDVEKYQLNALGHSNEDIARFAKIDELMGGKGDLAGIYKQIAEMNKDPEAFNKLVLSKMQEKGGDDLNKVYEKIGNGSMVTEDQLNEMTNEVATKGGADLFADEIDKLYKDIKDKIDEELEKLGLTKEQIAGMSDEEKKAEYIKQFAGKSAFEVQQMLAGKSQADIVKILQDKINESNEFADAIANADVTMDALLAATKGLDENSEEYKTIVEYFKKRMNVTTTQDKTDAESQAYREKVAEYFKENNKDYANKLKSFLDTNKDKTEDDFIKLILEAEKYKADYNKDDTKNKNINYAKKLEELGFGSVKHDQVGELFKLLGKFGMSQNINDTVKTQEGYDEAFDARVAEILKTKNEEALNAGDGAAAIAMYNEIAKDANKLNILREMFEKQNPGESFASADALTRASFVMQQYLNGQFDTTSTDVNGNAINVFGVNNGELDKIYEDHQNKGIGITGSKEVFAAVYDALDAFEGDETTDAAKAKIREQAIRSELDNNGGSIDIALDPTKMSEDERKKFEFNQNILRQEMRNNQNIIYNLFKNSNVFGKADMLKEILAQAGVKDEAMQGKNANELWNMLQGQKNAVALVNDYMNSHENTQNKLIALGAGNMALALNDDTLNAKKIDAVLNSEFLKGQILANPNLDPTFRAALEAGELNTQQRRQLLSQIEKLESGQNSTAFKQRLNKDITSKIDPSKYAPEDVSQFFGEFDKVPKGKQPTNIAEAFDAFLEGAGQGKMESFLFKVFKRMPKESVQYDNWNRLIENKISEIKNDKSLSREERQKLIDELKTRKIYTGDNKPENFNNMTAEEKNTFLKNQDILKTEALSDVSLKNFIASLKKVHAANGTGGVEGTYTYVKETSEDNKAKHKRKLAIAHDNHERYKATAAMRNPADYADIEKFKEIASHYMDEKEVRELLHKYWRWIDKDADTKNMTPKQIELLIKNRESALNSMLVKIEKRAAKKVARDNGVSKKSYFEERGLNVENKKYRKYRANEIKPEESKLWSKLSVWSHGREYRRRSNDREHLANIEAINKLMEDIASGKIKVNKAADFELELKKLTQGNEHLEKLVKKMYRGWKPAQRRSVQNLGDLLGDFRNKPISVQVSTAMNRLKEEILQEQRRMKSHGMIGAKRSVSEMFIGKTYSNSTTEAEVKLHKIDAQNLNDIYNFIKKNKGNLSDEVIMKKLAEFGGGKYAAEFNGKYKNGTVDDLERFISKKLDKALKVAHNDTKFRSDSADLTKLNGRRVHKSEVDRSEISKIVANAMKTSNNPVYSSRVREYNSAREQVRLESFNLTNLMNQLKAYQNKQRLSNKDLTRIAQLERAIKESQVKLNTLNTVMRTAESRKRDFERAFASTQIKLAKSSSSGVAYNASRARVMERYVFPKTSGGVIKPGSPEARQVEEIVSRYMKNHNNTIQEMINASLLKQDNKNKEYVNSMSRRLASDFGRGLANNKVSTDEIKRKLSLLKESTKTQDKRLAEKLEEYLKKFSQNKEQLEARLRSLGIKIDEIKLKDK